MDNDRLTLKATWTPLLDGDMAYVSEKIGDGFVTEYGPMPHDMVKPLIGELKAAFEKRCEGVLVSRLGHLAK